jgi:hypothetical protein
MCKRTAPPGYSSRCDAIALRQRRSATTESARNISRKIKNHIINSHAEIKKSKEQYICS